MDFWILLYDTVSDAAATKLQEAHRQFLAAGSKAERDAAVTTMREAAEDLRNASHMKARLAPYEAIDRRMAKSRPSAALFLRTTVAFRLRMLAKGMLGADAVQFGPEMIPIALFAMADTFIAEKMAPLPSPHSFLFDSDDRTQTALSGRNAQRGAGGGGTVKERGRGQREKLCLYCDVEREKIDPRLPRKKEGPHTTAECPYDAMPVPCIRPLCKAKRYKHKAGGDICKAVTEVLVQHNRPPHNQGRSGASSSNRPHQESAPAPPPNTGVGGGGTA
uniref:Uncharacterized protein n=1 Tax=Chromera velia CCMP2878 TaxID=1169474 RepID=A0A0G4HD76_9ALVE|eukprot:Cvel_26273.t1-p1 / transcript=Cvel_26273.t1 / gene=Cvel_26273 / organism=Chromera_velia_CCMP2878 / gene_product=hypothetical protein / transcript_product=hypothetical protein / location=Cvel_scaffold3100:16444-17268(-) / protein_length=275 / sequence_SO=supercontig / SO=protein_coding / is_pseudo=false